MSTENKTVHFVSLGCPKNLVDSEIMLGTLMQSGYQAVEDPSLADTIVVNTCGFINESKEESIDKILEMAELKKSGQLKKLVVAGCLSQRYKEDINKGLPEADYFIGSGDFQNIAQIIDKEENKKKGFYDKSTFLQNEATPRINSEPFYRAYLKISEGCKKRCAFCAIPLIRGNLQSRTMDGVVSEAKLLVAGGVKELNVVSHDFTDYGWDLNKKGIQASPYEILKRLSDESGAHWIRVLYMYPDGIDDRLIQLIKERENLPKYFDMPLQHINDEVLKRMNRRMTGDFVKKTIDKIRSQIPDAVIRTQFIVGYPGETDKQYEELLDFVEEYKLDRVGCFKYSFEEETKSGKLDGQIEDEVKQERHDQLMEIQNDISREKNQSYIGKEIEVIVDGVSEETDLLLEARSAHQAPGIDGVTYINSGTAEIGDLVRVKITDAHDYDFVSEIVQPEV
ncbi:MAG: 30S ribosomal protein S12 methylthiotransferase RimO [Bdellovibrionales bacterium]|nr:30S ribosomal protein S12 methylthiotransferase RimO [Bdellovibrionales bacterium]